MPTECAHSLAALIPHRLIALAHRGGQSSQSLQLPRLPRRIHLHHARAEARQVISMQDPSLARFWRRRRRCNASATPPPALIGIRLAAYSHCNGATGTGVLSHNINLGRSLLPIARIYRHAPRIFPRGGKCSFRILRQHHISSEPTAVITNCKSVCSYRFKVAAVSIGSDRKCKVIFYQILQWCFSRIFHRLEHLWR